MKKYKNSLIAITLVVAVVTMLILSGPASAVRVGIQSLPSSGNEATSVTFTVYVDIESGERVNVENLTLNITTGSTVEKTCVFYPNTTAISGCTGLTISRLTTLDSSGYGYGYLWGYDYVGGINRTWGYGYGYTDYGYGYTSNPGVYPYGEYAYNVTWTLPSVSSNTVYSVQLIATLGRSDTFYNFASATSNITVNNVIGGGGGTTGGGTSTTTTPTPDITVESSTKASGTLSSASSGDTATFDFSGAADLGISGIDITFANDVTDVTFEVEQVGADQPADVAIEVPGIGYVYFKITTNLESADISSATINFEVPASWVTDNSIDTSTVTLYRYVSGTWVPLTTTLSSSDADSYNYAATTTGFSYFAIGAEEVTEPAPGPGEPGYCTPGETRCSGDILQKCNPEGTAWEDVMVCPGGCENGACKVSVTDIALWIVAIVIIIVIVLAVVYFRK